MIKIFYSIIFLSTFAFAASAQIKSSGIKKEVDLMQRMHGLRHSASHGQLSSIKINPYWESIQAPHSYNNSFSSEVQIPTPNAIWATIAYDSLAPTFFCNHYTRSVDGGRTWQLGTIQTPQNYVTYNLAATDGNTCYASMFNGSDFTGGGIFKTTDGGVNWKQLGIGQLFADSTFNEFVYFF